jgi:hypothetical protein
MYCSHNNRRNAAIVDPKVFFRVVVAIEKSGAKCVIYGNVLVTTRGYA